MPDDSDAIVKPVVWDELEWGNLLLKVRDPEKKVIPVIGPDLMQVHVGEQDAEAFGREPGMMTMESYLALRVAAMWERGGRKPSLSPNDLPAKPRFHDLICLFLDRNGQRDYVDNFYGYVAVQANATKLVHEPDVPLPAGSVRISDAVTRLAQITDFDVFVTTTGDQMLEQALLRHRPKSPPVSPSPSFSKARPTDLPTAQVRGGMPAVYHLFGQYSADARSFVLTEHDLLDYVASLQARDQSLVGLTDALRSRQLLLLGGGFHDWLARFFLRTMKPQLSAAEEVLADSVASTDEGLMTFLHRFSPRTTVLTGGGAAFVSTLYEKWKQPEAGDAAIPVYEPPAPVMPQRTVFISYSSENRDQARMLRQQLRSKGVEAWFDVEQLEAGDNWEQKIKLNIQRCTVFLPLISASTETRLEAFFRREWKQAASRADAIDDKVPFILPLLVEPERAPEQFHNVPEAFLKPQWGRCETPVTVPDTYLDRVQAAHQLWLNNLAARGS